MTADNSTARSRPADHCAASAPELHLPHVGTCPLHRKPWVAGEHFGRRRCTFYIPEFGASEDYGCPQEDE